MNPEEGDLRPQLLDRFGLMVDVTAPRDPALQTEVVRRRIAFESNPAAFVAAWADEETALQRHIGQTQARLPHVTLDDQMLMLISRICTAFDVDGVRADITLHKTARALAAWEARETVTEEDVRRAAEWVLPHRRRRQPFEPPELNRDKLDDLIDQPPDEPPSSDPDGSQGDDNLPSDGGNDDNSVQTFTASKPEQIKRLRVDGRTRGEPGSGRRNPVQGAKRGRYTRSRQADRPDDPALDATLRAAVPNGADSQGKPIVHPDNLRQKVRTSTADTLILFVVDASGSMAARARREAIKGAVLALLTDAYQQRDRVGVIAFRGTDAELILAPTCSVERAEKQLQQLPTGGRTPLAHALLLARETLHRIRRDYPEQAVLLVLLSDGKANVPLSDSGGDPWEQTQSAAAELAKLAAPALLLDTETGYVRVGRGRELAAALGADYMPLDDLSADHLIHTI